MKYHESVMVKEVLDEMPVGKVIDCTLGTGGHTQALIEAGCNLLAIEADPKMLRVASERLVDTAKLVLGNFSKIDEIAKTNNFNQVDGVLFDLGVSNLHLKNDSRGFSFTEKDQVIDMRLNPEVQGVTGYDLLNALDRTQLTNLFAKVMKKSQAIEVARRVFDNRPIKTVGDLKKIVYGVAKKDHLDSATLPMLALRIAVNSELENLSEALPKAYNLIKNGGKMLVIVFHSAEEFVMNEFVKNKKYKVLLPTKLEIGRNQRARSAKLYVIEKYEK